MKILIKKSINIINLLIIKNEDFEIKAFEECLKNKNKINKKIIKFIK